MTGVFADSFYFLAVINPRDPWHGLVATYAFEKNELLVTTGWVLTEVGDACSHHPFNRALFCDLYDSLKTRDSVYIVPTTDELLDAGVDLYVNRPDKQWSLTDCISFVVMEREGIADALTGDKHFEQAGFNVLLK
jgi:predicted nucleic acid-binding protein